MGKELFYKWNDALRREVYEAIKDYCHGRATDKDNLASARAKEMYMDGMTYEQAMHALKEIIDGAN